MELDARVSSGKIIQIYNLEPSSKRKKKEKITPLKDQKKEKKIKKVERDRDREHKSRN